MLISLLMVFIIMLSVSVSFAVTDDDNVLTVDEGMAIDNDTLSVEENIEPVEEVLEASDEANDVLEVDNVVTPENWQDFIDNDTKMIKYSGEELIFEGNFSSDLNISNINIYSPIKLTGTNAVMTNVSFYIMSSDVTINGFTLIEDKNDAAPILVMALYDGIENVEISDVKLNFTARDDVDSYAIWISDESDNIRLLNNEIHYVGTTVYNESGTNKKFAVLIEDSSNILIKGNKFDISSTSCRVDWPEEPPGSRNYVRHPNVSGIRITDTEDVTFENNTVYHKYSDISGNDDTIYVLDFDGCDNAVIKENSIESLGNTHTYNILITGNNFSISSNNLAVYANEHACGIDIEGPASGVVENNKIVTIANTSAYAIYSGMNGKNVFVNYTGNDISGSAYNFFGMSLGDIESIIKNNKFIIDGNYTTGIAYMGSNITIEENSIVLRSSEKGNESIWEGFGVEAVGIKVIQGNALIKNNNISTAGKGLHLSGEYEFDVENNSIDVVGNFDKNAYAIYVSVASKLTISGNDVSYKGNTNLTGINNAVYIIDANNTVISQNKFDLDLISCCIDWVENPGTGVYEPKCCSEGILIKDSQGVLFDGNNLTANLAGVAGVDDTIYVIDLSGSDNSKISNNNIVANGHKYIYAVHVTSANFTISSNNITSVSDNYAAYAINPDAGASGVVKDNNIKAIAPDVVYTIYSKMYGSVSGMDINYTGNEIYGNAYYVEVLAIGGESENIIDNTITAEGNYTIAVNSQSLNNIISGNTIKALGSCEGNKTVPYVDEYVTEAIKLSNVNASVISNNKIESTGDVAIDLGGTDSSIDNNSVSAKKSVGAGAIVNAGSQTTLSNNIPALKSVISAPIVYTEYVDGVVFPVVLMDENGEPISNETIFATIGGVVYNETTDANGFAVFVIDLDAGAYNVSLYYNGNDVYGSKTKTSMIVVDVSATGIIAPASKTVLVTALKSGSYISLTLKDMKENGLGNKTVEITFNGKTNKFVTNELGVIKYKIPTVKAATYTLNIKFAGDKNFVGSQAKTTVKINKEASKLAAAKKTFKVKAKSKKYTVTLKDSKGKAIKKVKVTLKVKGKTLKATTNNKGQATFNLKVLNKKGSYTAVVNFAGNNYYKAANAKVKITVKK